MVNKSRCISTIFSILLAHYDFLRSRLYITREFYSTMSVQINTVSGTIYEDFIVKMMGIKVPDLTASVIMKCTAVIIGFICVGLVFVVEKLNGILQV